MSLTFDLIDLVRPYIDRRVSSFGLHEGMTVVDYGCGPGRYTTRFSKLVGDRGKVYAVDIHDGHQPRQLTKDKILASGVWTIAEETSDHLKYRPTGG